MIDQSVHSYLLKPGLWDVSGVFYDSNHNPFPQQGQLVVIHEPDLWVVEGQLTINTGQTQTISSRYEVQPLGEKAVFTEWKSETGGPEPILGLYVMVGDSIMSPWQSRSGAYWGQEVLMRRSLLEYHGRGFAFLKNDLVSAWTTCLTFNG
ncbi:MAG: hypothetical protein LBS31_10455 [Candidatus Adiutrix sp.]|jgi:hypothetical protein|nr:hypothetical protein [Candidatus Adiutrix sp.]